MSSVLKERKCSCCKIIKDITSFGKNRSRSSGYHSECKECARKAVKEYRLKNKDKIRIKKREYYKYPHYKTYRIDYFLKRTYGITIEDYNNLVYKQKGKCAICAIDHSQLKRKLFVDHSHQSNKIRGLLCHNCNFAIGQFKDDPDLLRKAIKYLENL